MNETFQDKAGRKLVLSQRESFGIVRFAVKFDGREAAYACARKDRDILWLTDICVKDALRVPETNPLKRLFGRQYFTINFRRQELGKILLGRVIEYARSNQFKRIEGQISYVGADPFLDLPEWYRRRGFAVQGTRLSLNVA